MSLELQISFFFQTKVYRRTHTRLTLQRGTQVSPS